MKKRIIRLFAATVIGLTACSSPQDEYYITGRVDDPLAEGKMVYLFTGLNPNQIDSTSIKNGVFKFEKPIYFNDYGFIQLDDKHYVEFLLELDTITVDLLNHTVDGGNLNELFSSLKKEEEQVSKSYESLATKFIEENKAHYKDNIELEQALDSLENATYRLNTKSLYVKYFSGNENNMIGVEALYNLRRILPIEEVELYLRLVGEQIMGHSIVQGLFAELINDGPTAEGKMFQDFSSKQDDGEEFKLSHYVGRGKYVLVEFWASWSEACIRELPYLKAIYKKYKDSNFEILGVAIWDNPLNSIQAIDKHEIPWPQLLNTKDVAAQLYDLTSVPYIILFAPDGTILKRGILKEDVLSVLMEHIN